MKDVCALTSLDKERQCLPLKKMRVCLHSCETEILSICEAEGVTGLLLCIKDSDSLNSGFSTFWRPESHSQIPYSLFISYHLPPWGVTISCNMSSNQEEGRGRDQPPSAVEKAGSQPWWMWLRREAFRRLRKVDGHSGESWGLDSWV